MDIANCYSIGIVMTMNQTVTSGANRPEFTIIGLLQNSRYEKEDTGLHLPLKDSMYPVFRHYLVFATYFCIDLAH